MNSDLFEQVVQSGVCGQVLEHGTRIKGGVSVCLHFSERGSSKVSELQNVKNDFFVGRGGSHL